jgi:uncharacterized protein (TIGR01777 family)
MTKILISGGSGLLGSNLTKILELRGHEVSWLSRNPKEISQKAFYWNPATGEIDPESVRHAECIIHLAGAGVADKRWTAEYKKEILHSRIQSTELLFNTLKQHSHQVQTFLSASAVGYYGNHPAPQTTELEAKGNTFLADVCEAWEMESMRMGSIGIRIGIIRIGIILSKNGGFLKEVSFPAKYGFAAALGNGKMLTPWIDIDDLSRMFLFLLENKQLQGIYNGVAPNPASNKELTSLICKALNRPFLLPGVPEFVLKVLFGEITPMLLANQDISAAKILQTGFKFMYPQANDSVVHQLKGK